ncbi:protein phosphatase CheZ [Thiovibrio sp. JS02]
MSTASKSEVNLEISTGFFRISTDKVVYNITVLDGPETGANRVAKQIVAAEGRRAQGGAPPESLPEIDLNKLSSGVGPDDYYKKISTDIFNDIGKLAKSLSSTMGEIPAEDRRLKRVELDEAGEKIEDAKNQLHDIVSMTEKATMEIMDQVEKVQRQTDGVKELLSLLKNHPAFQVTGEEPEASGGVPGAAVTLQALQEKIAQANSLVASLQGEEGAGDDQGRQSGEEPDDQSEALPGPPDEPEPRLVTRSRYLFAIDTIFQTMYELCTNETVKTHISGARKKAGEIFANDAFIESLNDKVKDLAPDSDNFFTVPLSDVLQSLLAACADSKIQNLLKKMDLNQKEIFLDQSLPLEVPPAEEIEETLSVSTDAGPEDADATVLEIPVLNSSARGADPRVAELSVMLAESQGLLAELETELVALPPCREAEMSMMSMADQKEIFSKIEDAFHVTASITEDVTRITEALSFQDLSGQQILKIIKLLTDFQVQLLAIVVSFGSQLKHKEEHAEISVEESKRLAQEDVDKYLKSMTTEQVGGEGTLDQNAVNSLLAEMGF